MPPRKDTIFEQFLAPIVKNFLIDRNALEDFHDSIDWPQAVPQRSNPQLVYPRYYQTQHFHGIEQGYLSVEAAVSYDAVTQYALPPNEAWVRQAAIDAIQGQPRRILDLGCGTGTMAMLLHQAFPQATVVGVDLSPYMLVAADRKALGTPVRFRHAKAEATGLAENSFDLVMISLVLHETPPAISQAILQEAYRVLSTGGEVVVLDGHQQILRNSPWLTDIFEEPYIRPYAEGNVDAWLGSAGFGAVRTQDVWLVHQLSHGVKGIHDRNPEEKLFADLEPIETEDWVPG